MPPESYVTCGMQVSRCGMIYMEPDSLGWRPLFKSWLHTLPLTFYAEHKRILSDMFERFVDPCLALVRKRAKVVHLLNVSEVRNTK